MQWSGTETIECHILPRAPNGKGTQTIKTELSKTAQAESQEDSTFPIDGHRAIVNKTHKKSKTTRKRTNNDRINHNRNTALERSITNYWGWRGGGRGIINGFYTRATLALGSAVIQEHTRYLGCVKDFLLINATQQQTYKPRFNNEMKQDEYLTARPTLKRWSKMNLNVNPGGPDQRQSIKHQPT